MERSRALEFTRQNTGKYMTDSGFSNGRIWQQPAPPENAEVILAEYPLISVTQLLVDCAEELPDIMAAFAATAEEDERANWFEIGARTMEALGYVEMTGGNTYNAENDLDQNFDFKIYLPEGLEDEDWIYHEAAVCVLHLHTGADVRGGYSAPLAVKWTGEYSIPLHYCVEYYCEDEEGPEDGPGNFPDRYTCGYSGNPRGQLEKDGFTFKEITTDGLIFEREGEDFTFYVSRPYMGE